MKPITATLAILTTMALTGFGVHLADDNHPRVITHTVTQQETVTVAKVGQECSSALSAAMDLRNELSSIYNTFTDAWNNGNRGDFVGVEIDTWPISQEDKANLDRDLDRYDYWISQCEVNGGT